MTEQLLNREAALSRLATLYAADPVKLGKMVAALTSVSNDGFTKMWFSWEFLMKDEQRQKAEERFLENTLGGAAGPSSANSATADTDVEPSRRLAREAALAVMEAQEAPRKSQSFSSAGSTKANKFLAALNMVEVCGNDLYAAELQIPDGTPTCSSFDFSPYSREDQATVELLKHHQEQLELLGVKFGQAGAFKVFDVRDLEYSLVICRGTMTFKGIFDACIAPFGLYPSSAVRQCRIVYEHKMPQELQKRNAYKGQAILELLAANAYGPCPVLLDLTDGSQHDVYTIRGKELVIWAALKPTQAYYLQARHLLAHPTRAALALTVEEIPEVEQAWMRPLHELRPVAELEEQLE